MPDTVLTPAATAIIKMSMWRQKVQDTHESYHIDKRPTLERERVSEPYGKNTDKKLSLPSALHTDLKNARVCRYRKDARQNVDFFPLSWRWDYE